MSDKRLDAIISLVFFVTAFLLAWSFIGPRALPWWVDGGEWLKYARGLLGQVWPMWGESPLNYPPLFPSILAMILSLTGDASCSIKFLAALAFALRPAAAYIFSRWVFESRVTAFSAAAMMLTPPIHVEILGWGGYPNLLCLSLLMIALGSLTSWLREGKRRDFLILAATSVMIVATHSLGMLIYSTTLFLLLISSLALRRGRKALKIFIILLLTLGAYAIYWLAFLWPPRYVLNNEAAYYHLKVTISGGLLTWIFKSGGLLLTLYALTAATIAFALIARRRLLEVGVLAAWLISPLLLLNLHELGVAIDYQRVFFFFTDPFILLASSIPSFVLSGGSDANTPEVERLRKLFSRTLGSRSMRGLWRLTRILLLLAVIAASVSSICYGYWTFMSVNGWYNYRDKYGDWEKLEALKWIEHDTPSKAVFVAEEEIGRWIEGYSSRRVLMYAHPMYLFIRGERERAYAAKTILLSSTCLTNGAAALYETHDPRENVSTRIALKTLGALETIFFLEANSSYVEVEEDGKILKEYLSEAERYEVLEGPQEIKVQYVLDHLIVEKVLRVKPGSAEASLLFRIEPRSPNIVGKRLVVELKPWPKVRIWEVEVKPRGRLLLKTNLGPILVKTNASTAFPFIFEKTREAMISFSSIEGSSGAGETELVHSGDLMRKYGARYIIVPRIQEERFKGRISLKPVTKPEYMHLLSDPRYRIAYQNERVIILELAGG